MKKKPMLLCVLSAGLILSSTPAFLPSLPTTYHNNQVYADASPATGVQELSDRLIRVYGLMNIDEKREITKAADALARLSNDAWNDILGDALISTVDKKLKEDGKAIKLARVIGGLVLSTNPKTLVSDINQFRTDYAGEFHTLFGNGLTVDRLLNFIAALEGKLTDGAFIASQMIEGTDSIDQVIINAIDELTKSGSEFADLDGVLASGIGIGLNDLVAIRTRLAAQIDPDKKAISAVVQAIGREKEASIVYPDNFSRTNVAVNTEADLNFSLLYQGKKLTVTPFVRFISVQPQIATITGNRLKAVATGTATIRAVVFDNITIATDTITVVSGVTPPVGGGGGGVTPPDQTPSEQVTIPVTENKGTNENGQSTLTLLPDENALLDAAVGSEAPVALQLTSNESADIATAMISGGTIQSLSADSEENLVSFSTGNGTIEIKASELEQALKTAFNQGVDPANAQIQLILVKGTEEEKGAVANALGTGSAVLAPPLQTKLVVTAGDQKVEVEQFTAYVNSSLTLKGSYPAANLVGVEWKASDSVNKGKRVQTAASLTGQVAPIPTTIEVKDGNTIVHVMKKTNLPYTVVQTTKSFTDVTDQWYANDVKLLANKLLIKGRTTTTFDPQGRITRAEFAALLVRGLGLPEEKGLSNQFTDIRGTDWYAGVIGAAYRAGLINGYPDKSARPNRAVTREEAAKMIAKAYEVAGRKVALTDEEKRTLLANFADAAKVSTWAADSLAFAAKEGILKGEGGKINPGENATRAESAALFKRLLTALKFISE